MKHYSVRDVVKALSQNEWTAIVIDSGGAVTALIATAEWPTPEFMSVINRDHPDRVVRLIPCGTYTAAYIENILKSAKETFALRDQGLLGSGMTSI
jgi:hypothetical protein